MSDDSGRNPDSDEDELLDESELDPSLAMPSPRIYRGSLIALLLGSIFAVWLLILPPAGADQDSPPASIGGIVTAPSPTATAEPTTAAAASPTTAPLETPSPTATAEATAPAEPTAAPTPQDVTYTVVPGDTMLAIAEQFLPPGGELNAFANEIAEANGIGDITNIQVGQVLVIPSQ